ncbi:BRO-N domain-containing protein, partial [Streptococcus suis]
MELQIFKNEQFGEVQLLEINNEPWFVGKEIAEILGYQNPSKALKDHVDEEDKLNNETLLSLGQRGGWIINESGLYSLILKSKLPQAKQFKRWVTSEVLPAIRKHGGYLTDNKLEEALL